MAATKKTPIVAEKRAGPPPPAAVRNGKYPWRTMKKGESFLIPVKTAEQLAKIKSSISACMARLHKESDLQFTLRTEKDGIKLGVRVWRIE